MSVIVIGSGVAGSIVAEELLAANKGPVIMLEAGPDITMSDRANWLQYVTTRQAPYMNCYDNEEDFESTGIDTWNIKGGRVIGRGGSTLHWGGWVPRFRPEDFNLFTNTGKGLDWPFSYDELEPYYCQAEEYLGVAGDSNDKYPVRSKSYPFEAASYPLMMRPIIESLKELGMSYSHMPVSRYGLSANRTPCMTTGTCKYCPIGARYTGDQSINDLLNKKEFSLILNAPATRILLSSKSQALGVEYLDTTRCKHKIIEADYIFICAGALETPKLLLNSKDYWSHGIGNDNDLVGRYLMASPYFYAAGNIRQNPDMLEAELGFPTLCSHEFDTPGYQTKGKFFFNADYAKPHLNIASLMAEGKSIDEIKEIAVGPTRYSLQGTMAATPFYDNRVTPGNSATRFGLPISHIDTLSPLYDKEQSKIYLNSMENILKNMGCTDVYSGSYPQRGDHAMGTCRMAVNEANGVVDSNLKIFGMDNVYIMGHATFPSMGAVNPTLTLVASTLKAMKKFIAKE